MCLQALARLWRVAHFVLTDFLNLSLQQSAETSSPLLGLNMAPAESLMVDNPSRPTARSVRKAAPKGSSADKTQDVDEAAEAASTAMQSPSDQGLQLDLLCLLPSSFLDSGHTMAEQWPISHAFSHALIPVSRVTRTCPAVCLCQCTKQGIRQACLLTMQRLFRHTMCSIADTDVLSAFTACFQCQMPSGDISA